MIQEDRTRKYLVILLIAVVPLFSLGVSNHGLWTPDEPRVAEVGREMALTGNFAVPTLNGKPFLEEPPLYYASLALVFKALGAASDKVARIPSALFAFGCTMVVFFLAFSLFGPRVALFSALVLATSGEYFRVAHWILVDGALAFFVTGAMALFLCGYLAEGQGRRLLFYILFYVSCAFAFLVKGFIGLAIPGLGIITFLAFEKNLKELLRMRLWLGILIFVIVTLPWFASLWHQGGTEYLKIFFIDNHLHRFLKGPGGHHNPFYYYLRELPIGFLPWSLLLVPVFIHAFSRPADLPARHKAGRLFAKCWFIAGFVFLSVASTKRTLYLMPIFAPISLLTGLYMDSTCLARTIQRMEKIFLWALGIFLLLVSMALTPLYYYVTRIYPLNSSNAVGPQVIIASIVATVLSVAALLYLCKGRMGRHWIAVNASIFSLLIFSLVAVIPLVDLHKSFVPFCEQVKTIVPSNDPLYAYMPDETLRGAIPFYTGRDLKEIGDVTGVSEILRKGSPVFIVVRDSRGRQEKELLSTGGLSVVGRQDLGTDRSLLLFSNRQAG